jgi:hypothetical protein
MRLAIVTAVWGRPQTTAIFWRGAQRLAAAWAPHTTTVYAAGSQAMHRELAAQYGGVFVEHDNEPLSAKFNSACRRAMDDGAEYLIILGSDDLISPQLATLMREAMEADVTYVGATGCFFVEPRTRRAAQIVGHASRSRWGETVGPGRVVHRRAVEQAGGRLWPLKVRYGLDWRMTLRLQWSGTPGTDRQFPLTETAFIADIKGPENVWSYDKVARHTHIVIPADYEAILAELPEAPWLRALEAARCPSCGQALPEEADAVHAA